MASRKPTSDWIIGESARIGRVKISETQSRFRKSAEVDVELLPQRGLYVDLGEDAVALALQRGGHFLDA